MEDERDAAVYEVSEGQHFLNLSIWPSATYHWKVVVIQDGEVLCESETWTFKWYPPPPTPTSTATPIPTPTPMPPTPTPTPMPCPP